MAGSPILTQGRVYIRYQTTGTFLHLLLFELIKCSCAVKVDQMLRLALSIQCFYVLFEQRMQLFTLNRACVKVLIVHVGILPFLVKVSNRNALRRAIGPGIGRLLHRYEIV